MKKREYIAKTMRMASFLMSKGCLMIGQRPDINNPDYDVFVFEQTPQLWNAVTEYSNRKREFNK